MSTRIPCSALRAGECHNGFPVTAACHGIDAMPSVCMREEYCGRIYNHLGGTTLVIVNALKASIGGDRK